MSLNLKYRPTKLKQLCGNAETVKNLQTYLEGIENGDKDRRSILITGASGCGKTTIARLIGAYFGAYDYNKQAQIDFHELNASDFKGEDTIRAIRQQIAYAPQKSKYSIFFLDEAHKLTPDAQEAFLKPLEEPPKHIIFILATTNPEKLKITLKRRCAGFQVNPVEDEEIVDLMQTIVKKEGKKIKGDILESIGEVSGNSPGVALGILDSIIDLSKKEMKTRIQHFSENKLDAIELCRVLAKGGKWNTAVAILKKLKEQGEEPEGIRRLVMSYCASCLLRSNNPQMYIVMSAFREPTYNNGFNDIILSCYDALVEVRDA